MIPLLLIFKCPFDFKLPGLSYTCIGGTHSGMFWEDTQECGNHCSTPKFPLASILPTQHFLIPACAESFPVPLTSSCLPFSHIEVKPQFEPAVPPSLPVRLALRVPSKIGWALALLYVWCLEKKTKPGTGHVPMCHLDKEEPFKTVLCLCIHGCPHVMHLELSQTWLVNKRRLSVYFVRRYIWSKLIEAGVWKSKYLFNSLQSEILRRKFFYSYVSL